MGFFLLERLQSWRYIRPLQNPPNANRAAWYRRMSPADEAADASRGRRRNPRRKSVASGSSSLPATIVRRVRSSLGLAETGKGGRGRRGTAATTTSSPPLPLSPSPFKASPSSSLPSSPTPFDCCQHRHRGGTIVYDRFKSALQRLFAPSPAPAAGKGRKRGQKTPPAAAVGATSKAKKKRRKGKRQRRPRAKESSPLLCGGDADEDALLLSPPPSSAPARRGRREVRITPAKIPTLPAPVWPEYLYSYDEDGDSARRRRPTMFAPAASNLNFGLVTHSLVSNSTQPGKKRRAKKGGGTEGGEGGGAGGRGPSIWHLL